jgi:hypothetical protein
MKRKRSQALLPPIIAATVLLMTTVVFSDQPAARKSKGRTLAKVAISDVEVVDGNRILNYIENNGQWCSPDVPIGFGMQWPGANGISIDYASGFWVGGTVNDSVRTAAAEFTSEFQAGNANPDGTASDPLDPRHQILKINKGDLLNEGFNNPDYDLWVNDLYQLGAPIERDEHGNPILSATGKRIPDMIGDQMLWMVYNDLDANLHSSLHKSVPLGIEIQNTVWVFNRPDAFGDMMFLKFLIVNKRRSTIQNTFVGLWFDIDLGDANDDLVFCDTTLSLGAFWNDGNDTNYGDTPPAIGADFFQGPIVPSPGDTANVSGRKVPGFKNLGMSSFAKYIRNGPVDAQDPANSQEVYNFMLGLNGLGRPIIDPTTGQPTKFVNVSDPEAGTGWVDGVDLAPADRRMLMNSGPFTLEPWVDTNGDGLAQAGEPGVQEVVAGILIAQGTSARNSATRLKQVDQLAQLAYDLNFALPPSPPNPSVTVHNLNREVILTWGDEVESYVADDLVDVDEDGNPTEYTFQGYNIYQTDAPTVGPGVRVLKLGTFDIADGVGDIKDFVFSEEFGEVVEATVQRAPDTGVARTFRITSDAIKGGVPLSNWNTYWFVVTAYGYNPYGIPKVLESPYTTIAVQPQSPPGGMQAQADYNQMIAAVTPDTTFNASHTSSGSLSDGQLEVYVVDPTQVTGRDYRVTFELDEAGQTVWNLDRLDSDGPARVLSKQTNQSGDNAYTVADGILVKSIGPPNDFKNFLAVANANGPIDPPDMAAFAFNSSGFPTLDGLPPDGAVNDRPSTSQQVGGGRWGIHTGDIDSLQAPYSAFIIRATNDGARWGRIIPYDWEIRFTAAGGHAYDPFQTGKVFQVPFELWRIGVGTPEDPGDDLRMVPYVLDDDESGTFNLPNVHLNGVSEHSISGGNDDPYTDWIYWATPTDESSGDAGYRAWEAAALAIPGLQDDGSFFNVLATENTMRRMVLVSLNGGSVSDPSYPANVNQLLPETGSMFRIVTTKPNSPADAFAFSTTGFEAISSTANAQAAAQQVNLFPNPYFGQNPAEVDPITRFVTITHLPANGATIRIFTLAGDLIKTIDDQLRSEQGTLGTQTALWDLRNSEDVPVASGMYLVHIDMGSLGQRVLKAAIFMPEERLNKF